MKLRESEFVCPKCMSSYIDIITNGEFNNIFRCKNNKEFGKKFCNWEENKNNKFLSYFFDDDINIEDIKNVYNILYLFAESLQIKQIPSLYKNNGLLSEIEEKKILIHYLINLKPSLEIEHYLKKNL